jgi:hypothetical protein
VSPDQGGASIVTMLENLFGMPIETVLLIIGGGVAAIVGVGVAVYLITHGAAGGAAGSGAGGAAAGGAAGGGGSSGGEGGNTPPPSGGGGSASVPTGANVSVTPHPNVQMTFTQVNTAGVATANPLTTYPPPPDGIPFLSTVFDIKTTALFTGIVMVGLLFDGKDKSEEEKKKLKVYRYDEKAGVWEDVTSSIDTEKNIAYGATDHFSIFGVR